MSPVEDAVGDQFSDAFPNEAGDDEGDGWFAEETAFGLAAGPVEERE